MRLAIVEDHHVTRLGIRAYLEKVQILSIQEFSNPAALLSSSNLYNFQVFLLDLDLPGLNGIQIANILRKKKIKCKIIIFTAINKPGQEKEAIANGVDGFIHKGEDMQEFIKKFLSTIRGETSLREEYTKKEKFAGNITLNNKQHEVASLLYSGLSTKQIALELNVSKKNIDYHLYNLKKIFKVETYEDLKTHIYKYYF